jgi:hypothetical protein
VPAASPSLRRAAFQKRWWTVPNDPDARAADKAVAPAIAPGFRSSTSR